MCRKGYRGDSESWVTGKERNTGEVQKDGEGEHYIPTNIKDIL